MNPEPSELSSQILRLKQKYVENIPENFYNIRLKYEEFQESPSVETATELMHLIHRQAGTSGLFGFLDLSEDLTSIEKCLNAIIKDISSLNSEISRRISELMTNVQSKASSVIEKSQI